MADRVTDFNRDRWDRPLIYRLDDLGNPLLDEKPVPYMRASKLPDLLKDPENLTKWKMRKTAEGLLIRPDLFTRIAGVLANGDPDDKQVKGALNAICAQAVEAAGASVGSSRGTGLHALTEAVDRGERPRVPNADDQQRLDWYKAALIDSGYTPLGWEVRVVNDLLQTAGTFDRLWLCPDGRVRVGDLKTGKWDAAYPLGVTVQIAEYAYGKCYDVTTGVRSPIHPDLDLTTGLLVHLTTESCEVIPLDLGLGFEAAKVAAAAAPIRKWKAKQLVRLGFFEQGATMTQEDSSEGETA